MTDQELAEKVVSTMLTKDYFSAWLGVQVMEILPGKVTLKMTVRREMLNGFERCHGGVTFSFADSAFAFASNSHGRVAYSIENSMAYPAAVMEGDELTAVAEELAVSSRIGTYQVMVRKAPDTVVGIFRGTVFRSDKEFFQGESKK